MISTKKTESKWRRQPNGELVKSTCPVCNEEEETREHYEFGCKIGGELRKRIAKKAGREDNPISKEEWAMEEEGMDDHLTTMIAKARWIYHCQRCKIDNGQKKRMNIETVMQKLDRRMKVVADLSK